MDELNSRFSGLTFDQETATTYEQAFDNIVSFVTKVRENEIVSHELLVTKALAEPFTPGGLLVLLQEPLASHPWHQGIDRVIADCPTLDSLNEGVQIRSGGHLSLNDGVSVLDLWPFLHKGLQPKLSDTKREELSNLLFLAIKTKRPKILLCMGYEACKLWMKTRQSELGDTQVVYEMHPSHAVNYNETDAEKREELLKSIGDACEERDRRHSDGSSPQIPQRTGAGILEKDSSPETRFEEFLEILLKSCFLARHILSRLNIVKGEYGRYKLEKWHEWWFKEMKEHLNSTECRENQARAFLCPAFQQLNRLLRKDSWFLPKYEVVSWSGVRRVFMNRHLEIEYACYLLAGDMSVDKGFVVTGDNNSSVSQQQELDDVLTKMGEITARVRKVWENHGPPPPRTTQYHPPLRPVKHGRRN